MYRNLVLFVVLLTVAPCVSIAQPVLDSIDINESTSEMLLHGSFGSASGAITVDGVPATIQSWSEQQITASIPSGGKGSAGPVVVTSPGGSTKPRMITKMHVDAWRMKELPGPPTNGAKYERFSLDFRMDAHSRALALVPMTRYSFTSMRSSWKADTTWYLSSYDRDTNYYPEHAEYAIAWFNHNGQSLSVTFSFAEDPMVAFTDTQLMVRPWRDTQYAEWRRIIGLRSLWGLVEFPLPQEALWLGKAPSLKYPDIKPNGVVTLQTNSVPWMSGFQFQVATEKGFKDGVILHDTIVPAQTLTQRTVQLKLPPGAYHWRVRGVNSEGRGLWSNWTFQVKGSSSVEGDVPRGTVHLGEDVIELRSFERSVNVVLYDLLGREVARAGEDNTISTRDVAPGVYYLFVEDNPELSGLLRL